MKNKLPGILKPLILFFIISLALFSPNGFGAFVPPGENAIPKQEISAEQIQHAYLTLALMSNKEIEGITGKKLTLKEKAGLYLFRKEIRKKNNRFLPNVGAFNDDCFTMYLKNGDILEVKLIQISPNEIKYQRCNKPGDPEILIAKSDVFSIKDKNGDLIYSSKNDSWKKGMRGDSHQTESLALAAGIVGIGALTVGILVWPLGLAAGIVAFVLGLISLRRFRNDKDARGEGWAITGVVAGGLWIFFGLLLLIALAAGW